MLTRVGWMVCLLAMSCAASADVYKWIDVQGRVHYSDKPEVENAERLGLVSRRTPPELVTQRNAATRQQIQQTEAQTQQQRAEQATASAVQQDVDKSRTEQCKEAQSRYKTAIESHRLYRLGKDGERQYLTDAEITEARLNTRKEMDQACKSAG